LRNRRLRQIGVQDHHGVLRLLATSHHDLIAARTRAICRLHTTVTFLVEGHLPRRLQAERAARILADLRPVTVIDVERKVSSSPRWARPAESGARLSEELRRRDEESSSTTVFEP
jgi:hypothetical protein